MREQLGGGLAASQSQPTTVSLHVPGNSSLRQTEVSIPNELYFHWDKAIIMRLSQKSNSISVLFCGEGYNRTILLW